jgi:hypothetical protein
MLGRALEKIDQRAVDLQSDFLRLLSTQNSRLLDAMRLLTKIGAESEASQNLQRASHNFRETISQARQASLHLDELAALLRQSASLKKTARILLDENRIRVENDHKDQEQEILKIDSVRKAAISLSSKEDRRYSASIGAALEIIKSDDTPQEEKSSLKQFTAHYQNLLDLREFRQAVEENEQTLKKLFTDIQLLQTKYLLPSQLAAMENSSGPEKKAAAQLLKIIHANDVPARLDHQMQQIENKIIALDEKITAINSHTNHPQNTSEVAQNLEHLKMYKQNFLLTHIHALEKILTRDFLKKLQSGENHSDAKPIFVERNHNLELLVNRAASLARELEKYVNENRHLALTITSTPVPLAQRVINLFNRGRSNKISPLGVEQVEEKKNPVRKKFL